MRLRPFRVCFVSARFRPLRSPHRERSSPDERPPRREEQPPDGLTTPPPLVAALSCARIPSGGTAMAEEVLPEKVDDPQPEEQSPGLPTSIEAALMPSSKNIIITEPNEPFRIVHVNEAWCRSCGFDAEEVLGQTCRIMQGPGTCRATLKMLRQALLLRR
eukprot:2586172-Prymnesium_polylepis.1